MNNVALNIHVLVIGWTCVFSPLGDICRGCSYVYMVILCLPYCRIASFPQRKLEMFMFSSVWGGGDFLEPSVPSPSGINQSGSLGCASVEGGPVASGVE